MRWRTPLFALALGLLAVGCSSEEPDKAAVERTDERGMTEGDRALDRMTRGGVSTQRAAESAGDEAARADARLQGEIDQALADTAPK